VHKLLILLRGIIKFWTSR